MAKIFAEEYSRNDKGWVVFPKDSDYRKRIFPPEVMIHVARANCYLIQSCIEYVSEIGQTILDPFGGSGTIMLGALIGRNIVMIELVPEYQKIIQDGMDYIDKIAPGAKNMISLIPGSCTDLLPIPADHIIYSPPYVNAMKMSNPQGIQKEMYGESAALYQSHPKNIGAMNIFFYKKAMEKVYSKCFNSLRPTGTMTVIIKDITENAQRVSLSSWTINYCLKIGFVVKDWIKWEAPGTYFHSMRKARGEATIDDEDIIIFERR